MKFVILLLTLLTATNATLLRFLQRKLDYINQRPLPTYSPTLINPSAGGNPSYPNYLSHPVSYSIIPTGVKTTYDKGTVETGTIIPGMHKYPPIGSNYHLVPGSGAVLNINTRSKDAWAYALQPIDDGDINHHTGTNQDFSHIPGTSYSVPHISSYQNLPYETTQQIFNSDELDTTKFTSPIYVGSQDFAYPVDSNEYERSYTLDDGIQVTERGKLVTKEDGSIVVVKEGQYQYKRSDGEIVTVKWAADDSGFRIIK